MLCSDRTKGAQLSEYFNWGVSCGCVLLIIGVIAIRLFFSWCPKSLTRKGTDGKAVEVSSSFCDPVTASTTGREE